MSLFLKYVTPLLLFTTSFSFAGHGRCGTEAIWEHQQNVRNGLVAKTAYSALVSCDPEAFYDTSNVQRRFTSHFRIYFVSEGPHATTTAFIDTLAVYLEKAWTLHTQTLGMRAPQAASTTYHYQQSDRPDLYPVEVLEIDMIRDAYSLMGGPCGGCYGLSFPPDFQNTELTELVIDNDFRYPSQNSDSLSVTYHSQTCKYPVAEEEITNTSTGHSYADYFNEAIAVTAFHELYHAVQSQYLDYVTHKNYSYWLEASAVGMEEIGAPAVNDYWAYLNSFFQNPGSTFTHIGDAISPYGIGSWFLYNYKQWGPRFDKALWERISENPDTTFDFIYAQELLSRKGNPDSVFHDFSEKIFFSGDRAHYLPTAKQFAEDQPFWPNMKLKNAGTEVSDFYPTAFSFLRLTGNALPAISETFKGKASVALWDTDGESVTFIRLNDSTSLQSLNAQIAQADSAVLILSQLRNSTSTGSILNDSLPMRAYPNPWEGASPLCFAGLPQDEHYIEVWTRSLKLAFRKSYQETSLCLEAASVRQSLAPGLYHFRAGNHGKTQPFLVIY